MSTGYDVAGTTVPSDVRDPGLRLAIGVSRSGKTYGLRRQVYAAARNGVPVVAIDRLHEWLALPRDVCGVAASASTVDEAAKLVDSGARLIILRTTDVAGDGVRACQWAKAYDGVAGIACSEAHRIAPNTGGSGLPLDVEDCALAWAHHRVSMWLDTQRLVNLHRSLTEQYAELRVHAVGGELDLGRLRELGGRELAAKAREAARRLIAGEPGWHVCLRGVALPPYELVRDP